MRYTLDMPATTTEPLVGVTTAWTGGCCLHAVRPGTGMSYCGAAVELLDGGGEFAAVAVGDKCDRCVRNIAKEAEALTNTTAIYISPFLYGEAEGSDIISNEGGGYDPSIGRELRRIGRRGGFVVLTAVALRDLAEFADTMVLANSEGGNQSGARSCRALYKRCLDAARALTAKES